jgi:hypothetical protein
MLLLFSVKASMHVGLHFGLHSMCSYFNVPSEVITILDIILYGFMAYELLELAHYFYEQIRKNRR